MSLASLVSEKRILVCVGAGGVGKTTTAACLALVGARKGRRTLVLTIDPAKRLANALGLDALGHDVRKVTLDTPGTLHAMMLDQKRAFDEVVARHTKDPAALERILSNRIYLQISSALAGSYEYAAMAKLYELARAEEYELIVLDTPPTSNALDFLDAPERMTEAVDSPAIQWFTRPYKDAGRFTLKAAGLGAAFVLRRLARFVGSEFLEDIAAFLSEFNTILGGFRERAAEVFDLLRGDDVSFVLVASPEPLAIDEAIFFHDRLVQSTMPLGAFVVNRVHGRGPEALTREVLIEQLTHQPELAKMSADAIVQFAADVERSYRELQIVAAADEGELARLATHTKGRAPIVRVPMFKEDVFDIGALTAMINYLMAES